MKTNNNGKNAHIHTYHLTPIKLLLSSHLPFTSFLCLTMQKYNISVAVYE